MHSAALVRRLTAHRTLALQAVLTQRIEVAIVALTHRLVLRTFPLYGGERYSVVQIDGKRPAFGTHTDELAGSKAQIALQARGNALQATLPADPAQLFAWLLDQSQEAVLNLLAYCVAQSVDGITEDEAGGPMDHIARAAGLDMREWWTATAASYFGSMPRARVLEVVTEAVSAEASASLAKLKREALAQAAEEKVISTGWLPAILRNAS